MRRRPILKPFYNPHMQRLKQALPLVLVAVALLARLLPGPRTIDDSYITFRYTRNLLAGEGFVYNPGERVLGTTTPLYGLTLAGIGLLAGGSQADFPQIALLLNAFLDAFTCLLLYTLGKRTGAPGVGAVSGLIWGVLPFSVTFAIGGLETSLFVCLLTATAIAHLNGNRATTAALAALCLLTRPDAALLLAPLGLDRLLLAMRSGERPSWREWAAFLLPILLWVLPASAFYGSPLPHSISAKAAAYLLPPESALFRLVQHYATPFMDNLTFGPAGIAVGLVLYPFLSIVGIRRLVRTRPRVWPWLAFPWIWFLAYAVANPLIFRWYLTPPLPPLIFSVLAGAGQLVRLLPPFQGKWAHSRYLLAAIPLTLALRGWTWQPDHGLPHPAPEMAWYALELKYAEAADALQPALAAAPGATVAAGDIGVLGYRSGARILDALGLISPEALPYYPTDPAYHVNAFAVAPDLIIDQQPDFIVLLEVYGREGLFKDPRFQQAYELLHVVDTDIYDSRGMLIYQKKQAAGP